MVKQRPPGARVPTGAAGGDALPLAPVARYFVAECLNVLQGAHGGLVPLFARRQLQRHLAQVEVPGEALGPLLRGVHLAQSGAHQPVILRQALALLQQTAQLGQQLVGEDLSALAAE